MEKFDIQQLVDKINYHTKLYDEGKPIISDQEFDDLYFELLEVERNTGIYLENSPTQRINYEVINELKKVKHNHPMLSLAKTKSLDEVRSFIKNKDVVYMLKLDGLTCSLGYKDGKLVSAETRGNGEEGEDILHNALAVKSIPKRIPYKGDLTVDGEIICFRDKFKPFAEEYANSRNFAAGSIRLLDANESAKRNLDFIAWDLISDDINKLSHKLQYLHEQGFLVTPYKTDWWRLDQGLFMNTYIRELQDTANRDGFPIDGIVIKWDDCEEYAAAGMTGHHPRAALAMKFYDETYTTYLETIEFTMGRTGILTPVAIYHPVEIDGAECTRASLHNLTIMKQLLGTPYQGQTLEIFKANQIIPQVASAGIPKCKVDIAGLEIKIPEVCPICGGLLDIECEVDTEVLRCNNPDCSGSLVNRLEHFVSKKGLDIKGLSKATLTKLIDWDWVREPADLYELQVFRDKWIDKEGFGQKSVDNILQAIEESRTPTLDAFISAIGIPLIGKTLSKEIAKQFKNYQEFREAINNKWNFMEIDKIAEEKCSSILNFDYTEVDKVAGYMENIDSEQLSEAAGTQTLEGQTIVVTGKLTQFKNRDELTKEIQSRGGRVTSSVSKNTSWLVNNDINSTSSKNKTAERLQIPIITEEEFINLYLSPLA